MSEDAGRDSGQDTGQKTGEEHAEQNFWGWMTGHADWPAFDRLLFLVYGPKIMGILRALAELGVADLIAEEPRGVEELAEAAQVKEQPLLRVLRAAAALGIVHQEPDGRFALTPEGEPLRTGLPNSLRDLVIFSGDALLTAPYAEITHSVRTGRPAFEKIHGSPFYEHAETHPQDAALFDKTMVQRSWLTAVTLLRQVDLTGRTRLADIGGGRGHFLSEALRHHPGLEGLLFEREAVLEHARPLLEEGGVAGRVTLEAGDFFEKVPPGYEMYTLNAVLNGFDDADALRVLERVREAMGEDREARLYIFEKVMTASANAWDYSKLIDMDMLVLFGGRERTLEDWHRLTDAAGFALLTEPRPGGSPWTALECRIK